MKFITAAAAAVVVGSAAVGAFGPAGSKHNVLYFIADDLRPEIAGG